MNTNDCCCPEFNPEPWDEKEISWEDKLFVQDRVRSFLHIPLNFGPVLKRLCAKMEDSGVKSEEFLVLSDENSLWGTNVFVDADGSVADREMVNISGKFLTKVFEGPYKEMGQWVKAMDQYVADKGQTEKMRYYYYTTCPKCAKKYGKNYTVLLSQVD